MLAEVERLQRLNDDANGLLESRFEISLDVARLRAHVKHMWEEAHDGGDFEQTGWAKKLDRLLAALSAKPPCKVCGGSGFVAQKQFLDDGYGEVNSCPACDERDAKLMAAALPPGKGPMKKQKVMWAIQHVPSGSWDQGDSNLTLYWAKHAAQLACPHGAFKPIRVVVKESSDE